jgi:molybdate transport system substrate-binding protein
MKYLLSSTVLALAVCSSTASAVEITLIAPGGIRAALQQMFPAFEAKTGNTVKGTFGSGGGTKAQVVKGDPFDVPVVQVPYDDVIKSGHVVVASETPLANVSVGLAVRSGAPKPDISSADAVKKLLLGAKFIAYPAAARGAAAGVSFDETLQKLGIAEQMKPKMVVPDTGIPIGEIVAKGEAEIGIQQISELLPVAGIEIVGPLPAPLQKITTFSAGVLATANDPGAAKALVEFIATASRPLLAAKGLELIASPASP